jgi:peptidoglycan/LPS O-acetylase OafA/YrhL
VWMILAILLVGNNFGKLYGYHLHFVLGLLICCYYTVIEGKRLKQHKWYKYRYLILAIAVFLFSARQLDRFNKVIFFNADYKYWMHDYLGFGFSQYSAIASAVFLVAIIQSVRIKAWMNNNIFRFLGKISYCLYLMHWVVVIAIFDNWEAILPYFNSELSAMMAMMPVCVILSIIFAIGLHYGVELPLINYSKRLLQKMKPTFGVTME